MRAFGRDMRAEGRRIGLVPTMGALHRGHLSLIERARSECDAVVVSIYVNPLQFGPKEDFRAYPRDLERDQGLLRSSGTDALFVPEHEEIHVPGHRTRVEVQGMQDVLCGRSRRGRAGGRRLVRPARARPRRGPLPRLDYVEAVDGETLEPVATAGAGTLLAVAAWFGRARLIDNISF